MTQRTIKFLPIAAIALSASLACIPVHAQAPPAPPSADSGAPMPGGSGMRDGGFRSRFGGPDGMRPDRILPFGIWWKNPDIIQKLSLSADQQKRMADIFEQSRIQLVHIKASLEEQQILLEPMLSSNPIDTAKAQAQIDKIADTRADLEKANAKMLLSIRSVLTPDQWTKLQEEERGNRRRMMMRKSDGPAGSPDGPRGFRVQPSPDDANPL